MQVLQIYSYTFWQINMDMLNTMIVMLGKGVLVLTMARLRVLPSRASTTPPKTNVEPKNWWFVDVYPFRVFRFHVSFWGCSESFELRFEGKSRGSKDHPFHFRSFCLRWKEVKEFYRSSFYRRTHKQWLKLRSFVVKHSKPHDINKALEFSSLHLSVTPPSP